MAGLRIRGRRESSGLDQPAAGTATQVSSDVGLDLFIWSALTLILAFALFLRVYNLNWDESTHLHPDERFLTTVATDIRLPLTPFEYFDSADSKLNPYNLPNVNSFVYGTFPLFLTKITASFLDMDTYDDIVLVGRALSGLFSAGTVLLAFLIGRRLYGPMAGLLAACLLATAPLAIQHAHFFVVDPFLTFFTALLLYYSVLIVQEGRPSHYALAGLALGLGMACKITALVCLPVLLVAVALQLWRYFEGREKGLVERDAWKLPVRGLIAAGVVAFLAFRVAQPYAFETPGPGNLFAGIFKPEQQWLDNQKEQSLLLGGNGGFPPTIQWIGRESYIFPLEEMVRLGMGPAFGLAGWLAAGYAAYRLLRYRELSHLLPLVFVLFYFGFMGRQFSLYLRYFLPLYPVLAVLAGYALVELAGGLRALAMRWQRPKLAGAGYAAMGVVLFASALAGIAYFSIYTRPVTRVEASRWLYDNLPDRATIAGEHWDDFVPFRMRGAPEKQFQTFELKLYEPDTPRKVAELVADLSRADYVVMSSNRLMNSIPRNPLTYPVTTRYYDLMQSEQLGFRLLREFTSYPALLDFELADHRFEESWSSYDHPRVLVFQKTSSFSAARAFDLLDDGEYAVGVLNPQQADHGGLLLPESDRATQQEGGTWREIFAETGIARSMPTLLWFLVVQAAALAATPLAMTLFRRLPDRGYLLAKPLGLLFLAYPVWLLVSLKLVNFERLTILGILAALLAAAAYLAWRNRGELLGFFRQNWGLVLFCEVLFLLAFLFFRELRLENPDLWHPARGGEKPMDLAFLTATIRSTTLPPYDPWFAGGYINYYYLGQFFTATLAKLTMISPEVAFNLAVPTYFALTVAAAFSISYNLAATARNLLRRAPGWQPIPGWSVYAAGLLGVTLVAFAGNFDALDQMNERLSRVSAWHLATPIPLLDGVVNGLGGAWQVMFRGAQLTEFDFWRPSRMLTPTISITEFPYWSFLFADLHAHMMAIAFDLLALGIAFVLATAPRGERRAWREWAVVALLGLVIGSLRWLNSWDYPPFLLVGLAALVIGERRLEGGPVATGQRLAGKALLLVGVSFLAFKPFLDNYQAPVSGLSPSPEQTPLSQYLAHFGILLAIVGVWLLWQAGRWLPGALSRFSPPPEAWSEGRHRSASLVAVGTGAVLLAMGVLSARGYGFVAMLLPAFALVAVMAGREFLKQRPDSGLRLYIYTLLGLGLGLSMAVDLVIVSGDIQRMNTVFKFYLHTWLVFALVAAFAAWYLVFVLWLPALARGLAGWRQPAAKLGLGGLVTLVFIGLLYPLLGTGARLDDRFAELPRTLDGMAYMEGRELEDQDVVMDLTYDYEGIQWLRDNVDGSPAIVEGRTPLYRWGGRFSIYTGLPAVLGWDWHEVQQRGTLSFMVGQRAEEVEVFYMDPGVLQAQLFLAKYDVRYVILGQLEEIYYPTEGLEKFKGGLGGVLTLAYENPGLRIYRVDETRLAQAASP